MLTERRKALIIGGGIAGPAVALFLQRAGIDAEIYEAQPAPDDYAGLFLTVASNGMNVINALDLEDRVKAEGFSTSRLVMLSSSGKRLGEVPIGGQGRPSLTIKRGVLQRILREEVMRQGIKVAYGKRLKEIRVGGSQRVTAIFEDGTTVTGDILVGADGIHSRTRHFVDPTAPEPMYTGLVSGGGFAHDAAAQTTPDTMYMIYGKHAFFGYLIKPSGEIYWFENHAFPGKPRRSELEAIAQAEWRRRLLALHEGDQPFIRDMIAKTVGNIGMYPIYDIPTLPRWYRDAVILIGDAAHATSPSAGQGTSLALEDAMILAKTLRDVPQLDNAFVLYEQLRRERAEKIVHFSRERGNNKALSNPIARWFRDLTMPFFLKHFANAESLEWIYAYRVDWDWPVAGNRRDEPDNVFGLNQNISQYSTLSS